MSDLRTLLDKNVAIKILHAFEKNVQGIALSVEEQSALDALYDGFIQGKRLFIVPETDNILKKHFEERIKVQTFRLYVKVIVPARYFRRWARRLKELGFTREDARVLSQGTFSTDEDATFLGVDELLTFDKGMVNLFKEKQNLIREKLAALTHNIESPYDRAKLPALILVNPPSTSRE